MKLRLYSWPILIRSVTGDHRNIEESYSKVRKLYQQASQKVPRQGIPEAFDDKASPPECLDSKKIQKLSTTRYPISSRQQGTPEGFDGKASLPSSSLLPLFAPELTHAAFARLCTVLGLKVTNRETYH